MGGGRRPVFIWTRETEAADMLGMVSLAVQRRGLGQQLGFAKCKLGSMLLISDRFAS